MFIWPPARMICAGGFAMPKERKVKVMIYFDNSATTEPSEEVLSSFVEVNKRFYANPASLHLAGRQADALLEKSREQILSIVKAPKGCVIYTSGGTEANNLALLGFARKFKNRGKHIITTKIEHPSIIEAAKELEKEGFEVDYLPVNEEGVISVEDLTEKLREETIVVSIMHVNNEIGSIQPIQKCHQIIKAKSRAIFHVDAVQSFGKLPVDLMNGPDAITISGHKIHGLKGTGALITRTNKLVPTPINFGGGQEDGVRSGTVSVPNNVTLARAMRMAADQKNRVHYKKWREQLIERIQLVPEVKILAENTSAPHILSLAFKGINGEVAVNFFQKNNITVSTSSACSSKNNDVSHVIEAIQLKDPFKKGVIRISFGETNTENQIMEFKKVFTDFIHLLKRGKTDAFE